MINRVVDRVRFHNPGLCLPHTIVAHKVLEKLDEPSVVMMINFDHFYLHTKSFGVVDVYPNYKGELRGIILEHSYVDVISNPFRPLIEQIVNEIKG